MPAVLEIAQFDALVAKLRELETRQAEIRAEATRQLAANEVKIYRLKAQLRAALSETEEATNIVAIVPPKTLKITRTGPTFRVRHPFPSKVGNIRAWVARQLTMGRNVSYSAAKSWYSTSPKVARAIPRTWANILLREHGIPLASWKNGITDDEKPRAVE